MPRLGLACDTSVSPNVCVKPALLYTPARESASEENVYAPRTARGKLMRSALYRKSAPALKAWTPAWYDRLLTTWYIRFTRPVGLLESLPKEATPAMLTAGPIGSVGGACRLLCATCARDSRSVR